MNNIFDLAGEVAIVTGGMGILGSEYVKTLVQAGARVAVFDIKPDVHSALESLVAEGSVHAEVVDITNKNAVVRAYANVAEKWGAATILINNAGIDVTPQASVKENGRFEDYPEEVWDAVIDSHLKGAFLVSQEFIKRIRESGKKGSVINISSTYGMVAPDQSLYDFRRARGEEFYKPVTYSVAKSGMLNFTRWLAEYAAPFGVRVNTLVPGGVFAGQEEEFTKEYGRRTMLGRMAEAHEYNGAIVFLAAHSASSYMTGATLVVDGGWTAR